jgi:hypothetical protein
MRRAGLRNVQELQIVFQSHLASYAGLMQAEAYAGFNKLYQAARKPGPMPVPRQSHKLAGSA